MTEMDLIKLAEEAGFLAAVLPAKEIPVDGSFRKFCEDNLCGKYNANYSCPPGCGTVEEVHRRLFAEEKALVLEMIWDVNGFDDKELLDVFLKVCEDFDAVAGRKARMKEVFILSECGYDCKALAEAYGVSLATVYNRLNDGEAIIDKRLSETRLKGDAKASSRLRRLFRACSDLPSASLEKLGDPERNDHDKYSYLEEMSDEK